MNYNFVPVWILRIYFWQGWFWKGWCYLGHAWDYNAVRMWTWCERCHHVITDEEYYYRYF